MMIVIQCSLDVYLMVLNVLIQMNVQYHLKEPKILVYNSKHIVQIQIKHYQLILVYKDNVMIMV
jgi:hypothetical protein